MICISYHLLTPSQYGLFRKTKSNFSITTFQVPGGVAESDGRLMQGDQILEVNDKDLRQATQEQAAAILKCAPGSVSMKLGRLKAGKKANSNNNA